MKHELGPLPEELFRSNGPLWTLVWDWHKAEDGEPAGYAANALDAAIDTARAKA